MAITVLTPSGFQPFDGIKKTKHSKHVRVLFSNGQQIKCSLNHRFISHAKEIKALSLKPGEYIDSHNGGVSVVSVTLIEKEIELYDLLNVSNGNIFYSNDVVSHNCQFVSSDALLINSIKLAALQHKTPLFEDKGFKFWIDHLNADSTYFIAADISTGVGNDYSTIQVVEFPSMQQVAEYRSNTVTISNLYNRLKWAANWFSQEDGYGRRPTVYWSFEYNAVGAAIATLFNNDDNFTDHAELVSADGRTGLLTSSKTKIKACLQLKRAIEKANNPLVINSYTAIAELKSYVSNGASYAAKDGATDDLISALLIIMQMMEKVAEYDEDMFAAVHYDDPDPDFIDGEIAEDDFDAPMAVVF
jgi:hypothetical protein